jgi:soluble lytic murein transglycosylase-like protein
VDITNHVDQLSLEVGIPPLLAYAILFAENSSLDPGAVNPNTNGTIDLGLWQLNDKYLPSFVKAYWKHNRPFDWRDPLDNTELAIRHIGMLYKQVGKSVYWTFAAYNGGFTGRTKPAPIRYANKCWAQYRLYRGY